MRRSLSVLTLTGVRIAVMCLVLVLMSQSVAFAGGGKPEDEGSLIEKMIALPIQGIYKAMEAMGFRDYDELIFDTSRGDLSPCTRDEWDLVMVWYKAVRNAVWVMLVISMAGTGYRFMRSGGNPNRRSDAMRVAMSNLYAFAVVLFMPYFARIIFQLNDRLVGMFYGIASDLGAVGAAGFDINDISTGSIIATAFVRLGYAGLILFFNFLYVIRKFVMTSMLILTPIAAWSWSISGRYHGIGVVIGEIASNAFMQAVHAFVLALYLTLLAGGVSGDFSPWWAQIFGMAALIPTANVIRNLLQGWLQFMGVNEEKWAGLATLGLSGIAGLVNIGKTMAPAKTAGAAAFSGLSSMGGGPGRGGGSDAGYGIGVRERGVSYAGGAGGSTGMAHIVSGIKNIGDRASVMGGTAGKVIGGAMGLALGSEGAKQMAEVGQAVGSVVAGGGARAIAAGSGLAREVIKKRPGEEGGSMIQRLREVTGANSEGEALGSALGMVAAATVFLFYLVMQISEEGFLLV